MPADRQTLDAAHGEVRSARYALHALAQQRRAELLAERPCGQFAEAIRAARDALRNMRALLASLRKD